MQKEEGGMHTVTCGRKECARRDKKRDHSVVVFMRRIKYNRNGVVKERKSYDKSGYYRCDRLCRR